MTKVITGVDTRWSYVHVFEPQSINGSAPKYSVSLIIPKSDTQTIESIKTAIEEAYEDGKSTLGKTPFNTIKTPLRDGDIEKPDDPNYANAYFLNANSVRRPGVIDRRCQPICDEEEVYSGCYGRASISFYAFNSNGNRGIACGLNNLQKVRDGEHLGGRTPAEAEFDALDDFDDFLS